MVANVSYILYMKSKVLCLFCPIQERDWSKILKIHYFPPSTTHSSSNRVGKKALLKKMKYTDLLFQFQFRLKACNFTESNTPRWVFFTF